MPEIVTTQTAPVTPAVQAPETPVVKEDIVTRASKVTLNTAQPDKPNETHQEAITLDQAAIDKIADPALKAAVINAHKSMQADYTRKTQELAARRKEMDTLRAQLEQSGNYTPAKIQELLQNPSFVQAAVEFQRQNSPSPSASQPLTAEEFSYLSPEQQKAYMESQEAKNAANAVMRELNQFKLQAAWEREDSSLKAKYANYDAQKVTQAYQDMMSGKIQASREHVWKAWDYDDAVNRAYQLGLQDRKLETEVKAAASSNPNSISVTPASGDVPVRQPNQSQADHWRAIAQNAMKKVGVIK